MPQRPALMLPDVRATLDFGAALGACLPTPPPALFLFGGLGAGKTTLVRGLVESLPGGEDSEPASPSFNICNLYPTTPPCAHYDLYRLADAGADESSLEELAEHLALGRDLVVIEWPEYLPAALRGCDHLEISIVQAGEGREILLTSRGEQAKIAVHALASLGHFQMSWTDRTHG